MGVTIGGHHLEDTVVDSEKGHVEGATAEIEDEDVLFAVLLVEAVGNGSCGWFVDDAHDCEARDGTGVFGGLALGVVEVGWDGDDGVGDLLAQVGLGDLLHLGEDHGGDFLRLEHLCLALADADLDCRLAVLVDDGEGPVFHVGLDGGVLEVASDQALGVEDGVLGVGGELVLGGVTDQALALAGESDVRGRDTVALVVGDDLHAAVLHNTNTESKGGSDK